ncbi:MAG TPA: ATP-binding protein [Opitutaceae bacterium]|nr:ATP-binding protein [Opitutaceae bacterium]
MKGWRLRTKLTLWSALITGCALVTLGVVAALNVRSEEIEEIDQRLASHSKLLFRELENATSPDWSSTDLSAQVLRNSNLLYGYAIGAPDGRIVHAYPAELADFFAKNPTRHFRFRQTGNMKLRIGKFVRGERVLLIAADAAPARETVEKLLTAYFLALPIVLVVVGIGSWWMAGIALRPIVKITRAASAITAQNLDARLPSPETNDEIGQHIAVLNAMFDRLQRSFEQATRFTADASHELRTPLTILRGEIEDALRTARGNSEQEDVLVSLLEQTSSLQKIAANLLLLARFDAGKSPIEKAKINFSDVVNEAVEDAELLAAPSELHIVAEVAPEIFVEGDSVLLRRVLLNLIDNAVRYNQPGGSVKIVLSANGAESGATLRVANTGPGIPAAKHVELFQRFFRIDHDRNRSTGGSGLGLSLCREVIAAHRGEIALAMSDAHWTEFCVRLPRVGAD